MELKYAHLADYASAGEHGKMLIVGVFDVVKAGPQRPIGVPSFYIAGSLRGYITEGTEHTLHISFVNDDGVEAFRGEAPLRFSATSHQRIEASFALGMMGVAVPEVGEYAFHFLVDGQHVGVLPLQVVAAEG